MKNNRKIVISFLVILIFSSSCSLFSQTGRVSSRNAVTQNVSADQGATLALDNGASLHIPPNTLSEDIDVSIQVLQKEAEASEEFYPAGSLYEISLGKAALDAPVELTLPYNPKLLPDEITPEMLFIAYFDETQGKWIYAGGEVDQSQQVIRLQTKHASRWSVFYWNWDAWIAAFNKLLEANWVSLIEAVELLTNDCPQNGTAIHIQSTNMQNLLQGCIEKEEGLTGQLRVVNPKSFYYEIYGGYEGQELSIRKMLSPGESYEFGVDLQNPSPFTVRAEITQEAGYRLVIHQVLLMLPGFIAIDNQPQAVACLTERLHDVSYFASAAESLADMDDTAGVAAGESLISFLRDEDALRRFLTAADDCIPGLAKTWSWARISTIANLANVIISSTDYVANTLAMMFRGETSAQVDFQWEQVAVDVTNPQSIINWVKSILKTGNTDMFRDLFTDDGVYYAYYLEGGQTVTDDQFLTDLRDRISHKPVCQGIDITEYDLKIWYMDWQPAWQMTEMCYVGCKTISPPWKSNTAAFMFSFSPTSGKYLFRGMYQNTPENFFFTDNYSLLSCDNSQPLVAPTPVSYCPGSPPQRLKVGEFGKVCTENANVYLRVNPGKGSEEIVLLKPGTRFTVLDGPECAGNNWSWWKVKLDNGQVGWMAEGGDINDPYFLCPGD